MSDVASNEGWEQLHLWWELSYAQYLTVPRSVMQSMPDEWCGKMAALLKELDETIDWRPKEGCYKVELREFGYEFDQAEEQEVFRWKGKLQDSFLDYQRGNRRIDHKTQSP